MLQCSVPSGLIGSALQLLFLPLNAHEVTVFCAVLEPCFVLFGFVFVPVIT